MGWIDIEKVLRHNMQEEIKNDTGDDDDILDSAHRLDLWENAKRIVKKRKGKK